MKFRNYHRDALRQQQRVRSEVEATDVKVWKFQAQMEYLLSYMMNENRETNFTDNENHSKQLREGQSEVLKIQVLEENIDQASEDPTCVEKGVHSIESPITATSAPSPDKT
ncbi:hypothetical protein AVEN_263773-1 [Araneus ventricosus]|uniref:Uncharacterized protein n=1 Tax=Araneus ventricosus TaxID=182803 RepID=A0A4Y2AT83_ARAVE|nr:hypothetical protein AVEN_263773-1 [Araneus ventricosus]